MKSLTRLIYYSSVLLGTPGALCRDRHSNGGYQIYLTMSHLLFLSRCLQFPRASITLEIASYLIN
jgi:hypothetical protein